MFRKILICTDLSPAFDALIACAGELKALGVEEAILAHVIHVAHSPGLKVPIEEETHPHLERQRQLLEQQGLQVTLETPVGLAAPTLNDLAERHEVSLILIGSHGKGMLRAATLGSVSARLLHESRHPVLLANLALVEEEPHRPVCGRLFSSILFPTDFSEASERALSYVGSIAAKNRCPVTIIHVLEENASPDEDAGPSEDDWHSLLEAKRRRLQSLSGGEVAISLVHGEPAQEILFKAREGNFSLVVMGSTGKAIMRELVMGSVANEVARHAEVPVLFVPMSRPFRP